MPAGPSRLFHAIVVVGLASGAAGCGGTTKNAGDLDGGGDGSRLDPLANVPQADASQDSPSGSTFFASGEDAASDAVALVASDDDGGGVPLCSADAARVGCWPTYI